VLAALATILPKAMPPATFCKHWVGFDQLGQAGQKLFDVLFVATGFGQYERKIPDWKLAQLAGRGLRWVQKALRQLLDCEVDGEKRPAIDRYRVYGRASDAGRYIKIIAPEVLPQEKPPPDPKPAQKPRKPRRPINRPTPLTPEEEKAHAKNLSRLAAEEQAEEPTDNGLSASEMFAQVKAAAEAEDRARAAQEAPAKVAKPGPSRARRTHIDWQDPKVAEVTAELEAKAPTPRGPGETGIPTDPSGP
jgi:hypothetical protein